MDNPEKQEEQDNNHNVDNIKDEQHGPHQKQGWTHELAKGK
jgi:hypothetical protein